MNRIQVDSFARILMSVTAVLSLFRVMPDRASGAEPALVSASVAATTPSLAAAAAEQKPGVLETQIPLKISYQLYLPKDYEQQEKWPLMLFLHGGGERGDDVEKVKMHGPPKLVSEGKEFPFMIVSPLLRKDRFWEPVELSVLLDEIIRTHKVDEDRIWVTGLSSGGFGTWQMAAYSPNRFAALVPICGGGETYWTRSFSHVAVWAFHGARDPGIPVRRSLEMVNAINGHGGSARLTIYPEAGHNSWTETYNNPALYEWLLQQKRRPKP